MLTHPRDAALDPAEWQDWLASTDRFGMLAVNNLDPTRAPVVLPTHTAFGHSDNDLTTAAKQYNELLASFAA